MPRKKSPPRLYLDGGQWRIRDGANRVRTGCAESDREGAERQLAEYLGEKHTPTPGPDPLILDILIAYGREHLPRTSAAKNSGYNLTSLGRWWSNKKLSDVNSSNCRAYADTKTPAAARRDLEMLRAAINHWHREHGPLASVPAVVLPPKPQARDRWLSRSEVAKLLWSARRTPHLARFILLGIYTGTRSGALLGLQWNWIDLERGIMLRRAPGTTETANKRTPRVRLGRRILAHLRRWRRLDDPRCVYVCHYNGQRVMKMRRSWRTAAKVLGRGVTPHTLRHTRATWLMQKGIDKWEAAGHLGMSLEMLERTYGHHSPDFHADAAEV
jgi:integrase